MARSPFRWPARYDAAGKTPEQVNVALTDILKQKYINSPDVTVSVIQVNSKKYYIHGEVAIPEHSL